MPVKVTVDGYKVEELEGRARETAFQWLREGATDHEWYDCTTDHWAERLAAYGFSDVKIYFSGFCSQGDGACFDASVDVDALCLHMAKERPAFSNLVRFDILPGASIDTVNHHYSHEHTRNLDVANNWELDPERHKALHPLFIEFCEAAEEFRQGLCQEIYADLEKEYEYLTSEEQLLETADANEYLFDANGRII
ncbi:hypothetical protein LCGC14_1395930 [marine sediment metagenome]|uniref:Antitoxin of toxin-antitoxin stability system n=1 Tax=marine sediment metagenome TaxID=412755 RepID=A0A0F9ME49_9ZZZZ